MLTGVSASDPEIEAVTANHDVVFFTLSGISTTSAGVFFTNTDANPCVNTTPPPAPTPTPTPTSTGTTPPPPPVSNYGDEVNPYGNGLDVYQQRAAWGTKIVGWPATQGDPATHFLREAEGSNWRFEYAPNGSGDGLCVSNPGDNLLVLRTCNANIWQQFSVSGSYLISAVNGGIVVPDGTGAQLSVSFTHSPWGGDKYHWVPFSSLP